MQWIRTLYGQTQRYRLIADYGRSWDSNVLREHREIMTAALDRDVGEACRLFKEHAARTVDLALANLSRFVAARAAVG